jgi:hypothetical protein
MMTADQRSSVCIALAAGALLAATWIDTAGARDRHVPQDFQRAHPCPSTGQTTGACPGYVRDHVKPLCKGGHDGVDNMQWQSVEQGKAKDRWECKP